jgi:hypothetical protein
MNHWAFVTAAYVVTLVGTVGLAVLSWRAMRRAEAAAEAMRRGA